MADGDPPDQQEFATAHSGGEDVLSGDEEFDSKSRFGCPHCSKSYASQKSLTRHLNNSTIACAKQRRGEAPSLAKPSKPKSRWVCSRCGKDCATTHSVDRHIDKSCWKTCDECAADGVTRCDSVTKVGPCRTCEAKEMSCTKHSAPIEGTVPQPWTGSAARLQQASATDEDNEPITQQQPTKRKMPTRPETSPEGAHAHKSKRKVTASQQAICHGLGRVYDPLGGHAYVAPMVKNKAVSTWLQEQDNDETSSAVPDQAEVRNNSPQLPQISSAQLHHNSGRAPPPPANVFPPPHKHNQTTLGHAYTLFHVPPPLPYRAVGSRPGASPYLSGISDLPSFSRGLSTTSGEPMQLDHIFCQMEATRQKNEAHNLDMAMRFGPRNGVTLPQPFGSSGPLNVSNQTHPVLYPTVDTTPLSRLLTPTNFAQNDTLVTLRIHSNTRDTNGQPVFSLLRIRRDEIFGPHLDAYCANRGKRYGVDWAFVYRYNQTPDQQRQITLKWNMTPNNVNDNELPGIAVRDLDTIYVTQAKPVSSAETGKELPEGGAVRLPGRQVSHSTTNITDGETTIFQDPDVSRQWYQAIEQDATRLRNVYGSMKSTIIRQQQQLFAKDKMISQQLETITELTTLGAQLRERMKHPLPDPAAPAPALAPRDVRQRPASPTQPLAQSGSKPTTAFVAKCEAVRESQHQPQQHREPLQFPHYTDELAAPDHAHMQNMDDGADSQLLQHGRIHDAADKVANEQGVEEVGQE